MKNILVTGGKGQLAQCIEAISNSYRMLNVVYLDSDSLDITNQEIVDTCFKENKFDYCINCAAYTAVDKAELETDLAYKVNVLGAKNLAKACLKNNVVLFHISTDFVFDGESNLPYTEVNATNPLSVYGQTKLDGEKEIESILNCHYIIRTSWLYSEYGNNFVKTMLKLAENRDQINVIDDQIGSPTYAKDLARAILEIIVSEKQEYGTYHYSNHGVASWYDFAKAIFDLKQTEITIEPISTKNYLTPAKRPQYSVLNKEKIKKNFTLVIPYWKDSLENCLK